MLQETNNSIQVLTAGSAGGTVCELRRVQPASLAGQRLSQICLLTRQVLLLILYLERPRGE